MKAVGRSCCSSLQHSFPPLLPSNAIARGSSSPPPSVRLLPVSTPAYALQVTTNAIFHLPTPFPPPYISCLLHNTLMHLCSHLCVPLAWFPCRVSQVWVVVDLSDWLLEERLLRAQVTSRCNSCVIGKPPFGQVGF